jgi:hypothetical protein
MDRDGGTGPGRAGALAVAALLGFAAIAGLFRARAYDLFWHLAAGRWIVAHGRLPRTDPFRFSSGGAPWVDHEWLFQVAAYGVERLGGLPGLVLARCAAAVVLAWLLLAGLRRSGVPRAWAVPVVLAAVLGARPRMFLRPELVTLVALAFLLSLLQAWRRARPGRPRLAWAGAMIALVLVWANAHPGALAAPPRRPPARRLQRAAARACRSPLGLGRRPARRPGRGAPRQPVRRGDRLRAVRHRRLPRGPRRRQP